MRADGAPGRYAVTWARIRCGRPILISGDYPRREYRLCQAIVVAEESDGAVLLVELTGSGPDPRQLHYRGCLLYVPLAWALPMAAR